MIKYLSSLILVVLFAGCISQPTSVNAKPEWILNPNIGGKDGAVGSSMKTYDQKTSTQRKIAITRALDEFSLQRGVKVQMNMAKKEDYTNGKGSTQVKVDASYSTNNTITAHIEAIYQDKISKELFVWMVMD